MKTLNEKQLEIVMFGLFALLDNYPKMHDWYLQQRAETPMGAPEFPTIDEINDLGTEVSEVLDSSLKERSNAE